jgi:hypothetical protein
MGFGGIENDGPSFVNPASHGKTWYDEGHKND